MLCSGACSRYDAETRARSRDLPLCWTDLKSNQAARPFFTKAVYLWRFMEAWISRDPVPSHRLPRYHSEQNEELDQGRLRRGLGVGGGTTDRCDSRGSAHDARIR